MTTTLKPKKATELRRRRQSPVTTPTDLHADGARDISAALNGVLADVFALYIKT